MCDKAVCERWGVTWCDKVVCDKVVCERWVEAVAREAAEEEARDTETKTKPHTKLWGTRKPIGQVGSCESRMAERIH